MQLVLRGVDESDPSNTIVVLPGAFLDHQEIKGPVSKSRQEDLQLQSFSIMIGLHHDYDSCMEIMRGGDPPDRVVRVYGEQISVELTALTFTDFRRDFAQIRQLATNLRYALQRDLDVYSHLCGRAVFLSFLQPVAKLPKDTREIIDEIKELLREDRGCLGEDWHGVTDLPRVYPITHRGLYKTVGPVGIQVRRLDSNGEIGVFGSAQAEFSHSDLKKLLHETVERKDNQKNEFLLITCGNPDEKGCICPVDKFIFEEIKVILDSLVFTPKHLGCIFLHLWGTDQAVELFRSKKYSKPWPPKWPSGQKKT